MSRGLAVLFLLALAASPAHAQIFFGREVPRRGSVGASLNCHRRARHWGGRSGDTMH